MRIPKGGRLLQIENAMPRACNRSTAALFESGGGRLPAELRNLDRQRPTSAEPVGELVMIDDDDEPAARRGNDLLAQQSAAAALDQIEGGALHLVGAIDRKVDPPVL